MYVCIHAYVLCIHTHVQRTVRVCTYTCLCTVHIHTCTMYCTCMYVYIPMYCAYMYVQMYNVLYMYTCTCTYTYMCICTMYMYMYVYMYMYIHIYMYVQWTYMYTCRLASYELMMSLKTHKTDWWYFHILIFCVAFCYPPHSRYIHSHTFVFWSEQSGSNTGIITI